MERQYCSVCLGAGDSGRFIKTGQDGFGTVNGYTCTNKWHRTVGARMKLAESTPVQKQLDLTETPTDHRWWRIKNTFGV